MTPDEILRKIAEKMCEDGMHMNPSCFRLTPDPIDIGYLREDMLSVLRKTPVGEMVAFMQFVATNEILRKYRFHGVVDQAKDILAKLEKSGG